MLVRIDPSSTVPLYEQVAASIRGELAHQRLGPGDHLPAARELAESLRINVHTVLRAYAKLRDEGLIELRRRRGAVVTGHASDHARLAALVDDLIAEARRVGVGPDELVTIVRGKYQ
ncbi:GntR family transcriptional regulator [Saccharomonospora viridis]|jgi:GntR family transcriptional regulator|uniref:Transcriptional regulator, GntR family n=2 Tax=Saccharomonospora viridis TaxID=1852 RepID=C7MTG7_SACVD|nr:GntR family transcriptional regulator [Saccharomonospora viridis]ACU95437.1 transcriptional regulator, GntR family [Saccharomonospora viridis DSM 43017]KHF45072.1 GntR family transcriptional regulator [Saccharomonospora viridis]SFP14115.1 DNA-binding transcriptional regulator YhcF, GntR family [Saccharomonospora viridis]